MHPIPATQTAMYTLTFDNQPVYTAKTWHDAAHKAVLLGLATWAFNCLFVLTPGAKIRK